MNVFRKTVEIGLDPCLNFFFPKPSFSASLHLTFIASIPPGHSFAEQNLPGTRLTSEEPILTSSGMK